MAKTTLHGSTLLKDLQLPFRNDELRGTAMQADHELRKNPHDGFVQTLESPEVDGNFAVEHALLIGIACFTGHGEPQGKVSRLHARAGNHGAAVQN